MREVLTLGILAKQPSAGLVKTRLATETNPSWAAQVAEAFLLDVLDRVANYPARRVLAYSPTSAESYFAGIARERFRLCPQEDGDLGKRMAAFFQSQFQQGAERVVLLGTDSPTLPLAFIDDAFDRLADADVVLGPAADGGYYLIGCAHAVPPIFDGIAWGTPNVLAETIASIADSRISMALLPIWNDIDTLADWWSLRGYLAAARRAGIDVELPTTAALVDPPARNPEEPLR